MMNRLPQTSASEKWVGFASRAAKGLGYLALGSMTALAIGGVVLWDADFYTVRDRFEHFRLAMFGDWQMKNWCPPGRETNSCKQVNEFEAAFEDVDNFNFFKSVPVKGTTLVIMTGISFASARDVLSARSVKHWCYVHFGKSEIKKRLNLGTQKGRSVPVYAGLNDLSADNLSEIGLGATRLRELAKSHCRFGAFNPRDGKE